MKSRALSRQQPTLSSVNQRRTRIQKRPALSVAARTVSLPAPPAVSSGAQRYLNTTDQPLLPTPLLAEGQPRRGPAGGGRWRGRRLRTWPTRCSRPAVRVVGPRALTGVTAMLTRAVLCQHLLRCWVLSQREQRPKQGGRKWRARAGARVVTSDAVPGAGAGFAGVVRGDSVTLRWRTF